MYDKNGQDEPEAAFVGGLPFPSQHGGLSDAGTSHDYFFNLSGENHDSQSRTDYLSSNYGQADETQSKSGTNVDNSEFNDRSVDNGSDGLYNCYQLDIWCDIKKTCRC